MKVCVLEALVLRALRFGWFVLAIAILVLGASGPSRAQSQQKPARAVARATPAVQRTASAPSGKGLNTGITVHGHWVIEVKNPDGKLVKRVEFENALAPSFSVPDGSLMPGALTVPGGVDFLSGLLSGQATAPEGFWAILLSGEALGNLSTPSTNTSPCSFTINAPGFNNSNLLDACVLLQPTAPTGPLSPALEGFCEHVDSNGLSLDGTGLSCNLTAAPSGSVPNFNGVQLSGTTVAARPGQILTVATLNIGLCNSISNCAFSGSDGFAALTSTSGFAGSPIQIQAQQTISVTVGITFTSGS